MAQIKDLIVGEEATFFAIATAVSERKTANQKPYIECILKDASGSISARLWETPQSALENISGQTVKVKGMISLYQEQKQVNISKSGTTPLLRLTTEKDAVDLSLLIPHTPLNRDSAMSEIEALIKDFSNQELKAVASQTLEKYGAEFREAPASLTVHHAYVGGLLEHSYHLITNGLPLVKTYGLNQELFITGCILHDIGKIYCYNTESTIADSFTVEGEMVGHIVEGVKMLTLMNQDLNISKPLLSVLENMIVSHHFKEEWGSFQKPCTPEALLLHYVDLMDSKIAIALSMLKTTNVNSFSERERCINNAKMYNLAL